jgi:fatty acid desaturase
VWQPSFPVAALAVAAGALAIGYALAYLSNFFHEAAHHNLLPRRRHNDLAADLTMSWLFGSSIAAYREVHFQHHRALGTTDDSESSYFDPLRIRYIVEGLTGVRALRSLRRHHAVATRRAAAGRRGPTTRSRAAWVALAGLANLALATALLLVAGSAAAAVAWLAGLLIAFPFFVSLRQLLEHRSESAASDTDYTVVDHGATNRLFGDGPVASTLGGAGFNRHALHHWEPTVSYTRLRDVEEYLLRTPIAPTVRNRRTTYADTFLRLLEL